MCQSVPSTGRSPSAEPGSKGGAAQAWLDAQEEADRKNGRVIDKLETALHIELDQAQRIELMRAFVRELSGGKSVPFFAAFHDKAGTKGRGQSACSSGDL